MDPKIPRDPDPHQNVMDPQHCIEYTQIFFFIVGDKYTRKGLFFLKNIFLSIKNIIRQLLDGDSNQVLKSQYPSGHTCTTLS